MQSWLAKAEAISKIIAMFFARKSQTIPERTQLEIDGEPQEIVVRQNNRARRYRITLDSRQGIVLTVPKSGTWRDAERFLHKQRHWLAARQHHVVTPKPIELGAIIPLRGVDTRVHGTGTLRGVPRIEESDEMQILHMPGADEHIGRRTVDWLKREAKADIAASVAVHTSRLGVTHKAISMRDQSTRWGSCSSAGNLNFNWRLILAPPFVLDYVAAHEVAHLIEMNHSQAFWDQVERTLPDMQRGRTWLKVHGRTLFAYQ
ncbi:M48 family metallopeptidase [Maritalea porphyrae]|uniref:Metal-dependent hydrolase n=1 Tax=Maritalea porphyrae TaxID=880732 RepID=A0ABQ5UNV5_9HYPH|nr:SprT family zinc-dependent metalloprotease [Maritalea porphyrae]GLQ16976.1 metal-dependent hydrolase [Maritalea porphyrae]